MLTLINICVFLLITSVRVKSYGHKSEMLWKTKSVCKLLTLTSPMNQSKLFRYWKKFDLKLSINSSNLGYVFFLLPPLPPHTFRHIPLDKLKHTWIHNTHGSPSGTLCLQSWTPVGSRRRFHISMKRLRQFSKNQKGSCCLRLKLDDWQSSVLFCVSILLHLQYVRLSSELFRPLRSKF